MNISNREKKLLVIVLSVAVGVLYYNFVFTSKSDELEQKRAERATIEQKYADQLLEIKTIEERKVKLATLKETAETKAKDYYPDIIQENLIQEVDGLMVKNSLTGDYSWAERKSDAVENLTPEILNLPNSSTKVLADTIKSTLEEKNSSTESVNNNAEEDTSIVTSQDSNTVTEVGTADDASATPLQMVLSINLKGSYDSLRNFVQDIKEYDRVVTISALTTNWEDSSQLSATINIEFYSIPKINDDDNKYLDWN